MFFNPKCFQYKVCYRTYSVFLLFRKIVLFLFLSSHPISRRLCVFVSRLLPEWSVLARILRLVWRCHRLSAFRFFFGTSSSSSSSSSSLVLLSARFLFWTIYNFLVRISRKISSQQPHFPSRPLRQRLLIIELTWPFVLIAGTLLVFLSV